jgi:hypothetical protein
MSPMYVLLCDITHEVHYQKKTSDVGEAFRPVVPPWAVTAAYGVSWIYLAG